MKFKKEFFFSPDQWLSKQPELLDNPEVHFLLSQAKCAREALEKYLEEKLGNEEE